MKFHDSYRCGLCHGEFQPADLIVHSPIYGDSDGVFHNSCARNVDRLMKEHGTNDIAHLVYPERSRESRTKTRTYESPSHYLEKFALSLTLLQWFHDVDEREPIYGVNVDLWERIRQLDAQRFEEKGVSALCIDQTDVQIADD